jgi:dihydrolipoamide dehydrogenase
MWHLSNDYALACRTDRGYRASNVEVSYAEVMNTVRAAVRERRDLLVRQLERLAEPSPMGGRVFMRKGTGKLVTPHAVEIKAPDGSFERY